MHTYTLTKDILLIYLWCFPLSIKCHVKYCLILPPLTLRIKTKEREEEEEENGKNIFLIALDDSSKKKKTPKVCTKK